MITRVRSQPAWLECSVPLSCVDATSELFLVISEFSSNSSAICCHFLICKVAGWSLTTLCSSYLLYLPEDVESDLLKSQKSNNQNNLAVQLGPQSEGRRLYRYLYIEMWYRQRYYCFKSLNVCFEWHLDDTTGAVLRRVMFFFCSFITFEEEVTSYFCGLGDFNQPSIGSVVFKCLQKSIWGWRLLQDVCLSTNFTPKGFEWIAVLFHYWVVGVCLVKCSQTRICIYR